MDLALDNPQRFIWHKTQTNEQTINFLQVSTVAILHICYSSEFVKTLMKFLLAMKIDKNFSLLI